MLRQECGTFAKDDDDIGETKRLKLKINLKDQTPIHKTYNSIPKPLYKEVKEYIEELLSRGWIQKNYLSYASPMVCLRKKTAVFACVWTIES